MAVTPATEGQAFTISAGPENTPAEYVVAPKCDGTEGRWLCVTHGEVFPNQLAKDSHIDRGEHVLTWVCLEHGPEVP